MKNAKMRQTSQLTSTNYWMKCQTCTNFMLNNKN